MRKVVLDTDIIVDFLRKGIDHSNIFKNIKDKKIKAYSSPITTFELYNGALLSRKPNKKLKEISWLLELIEIIPFDKKQSYVASKSYAYLVKKGLPLDMRNILISSCALSNNLHLLTRNKKHFNRIPELLLF